MSERKIRRTSMLSAPGGAFFKRAAITFRISDGGKKYAFHALECTISHCI